MTKLRNSIIGATIGASVLAFSALSASARSLCWHTHENHRYPPEARVIVHPDNWSWGPSEHFTWREQRGAVIGMVTTGWNSRSSATATR